MLKCIHCGAKLDLTAAVCPECGHDVEMGRLTGILGVVCRNCDAYNEPGAKVCVSCGQPFAKPAPAASPAPPPAPGAPAVRVFGKPAPAPAKAGPAPAPQAAAPQAAPPPQAAPAPQAPIPLVPACPACGEEPGPGQFCQRCGQPLGARGTLLATPAPEPGQRAAAPSAGAAATGARLILERGEGADGATFPLRSGEAAVGRTRGTVTFPDDPCLAPLQATFFHREGTLYVRDEGAPGGVFLRLRGLLVPLRPGDLFCVGDRLLRFAGPLPAAPPPPPDGTRRLGSPRPQEAAILLEEWLEGGLGGRVYLRPAPSITIGRAGCSVNLGDDPYLSQAHAEIVVEADGSAKLRDLGSSNGTFLRMPARAERALHDGDMVRLGREVLRVSIP